MMRTKKNKVILILKVHKINCTKLRWKYNHLRLFDTVFVLGKRCKLLIILNSNLFFASHIPWLLVQALPDPPKIQLLIREIREPSKWLFQYISAAPFGMSFWGYRDDCLYLLP